MTLSRPPEACRSVRLGAGSGRSVALNQSNPGALDERFFGLKPALEAAVPQPPRPVTSGLRRDEHYGIPQAPRDASRNRRIGDRCACEAGSLTLGSYLARPMHALARQRTRPEAAAMQRHTLPALLGKCRVIRCWTEAGRTEAPHVLGVCRESAIPPHRVTKSASPPNSLGERSGTCEVRWWLCSLGDTAPWCS